MSFSKLARLGVAYKGPWKTPRNRKSAGKQAKKIKVHSALQNRINTVYEETDESFIDCSWDVNEEPVQRHSVAQYSGVTIRNPHSDSRCIE